MSAEPKLVLEVPTAIGEPCYTVEEIGKAWKLSQSKVRRLFADEPGVLVFENHGAFPKRRYRTLRVPQSVVERVRRRHLRR